MRADGVRTTGEDLSHDLHRKGPKRASSETDGVVAGWYDAAVKAYGKATALADELGIGEAFLSEMRSGKRGIALRHLLPILGHTEAVLAFVGPLLDSVGFVAVTKRGPTRQQVLELAFSKLWDVLMFREFVYREGEKLGWTRDGIDAAVRGEHHGDTK